jgi:hypothetical protein
MRTRSRRGLDSDSSQNGPILSAMRLYLVSYQSHQAEFVGAAIVEAFDPYLARERAEAAGIHQPGAMSIVTHVDGVPPELIGGRAPATRSPSMAWNESLMPSILVV